MSHEIGPLCPSPSRDETKRLTSVFLFVAPLSELTPAQLSIWLQTRRFWNLKPILKNIRNHGRSILNLRTPPNAQASVQQQRALDKQKTRLFVRPFEVSLWTPVNLADFPVKTKESTNLLHLVSADPCSLARYKQKNKLAVSPSVKWKCSCVGLQGKLQGLSWLRLFWPWPWKKTGSLHLFLQVMEQNELMCHDERYNWIKWADRPLCTHLRTVLPLFRSWGHWTHVTGCYLLCSFSERGRPYWFAD